MSEAFLWPEEGTIVYLVALSTHQHGAKDTSYVMASRILPHLRLETCAPPLLQAMDTTLKERNVV